jgi:hypothetical protein
LKIHLENHELKVLVAMDQWISKPVNTMMQYANIVTEAIEKENMQDQREIKIAFWLFLHTHQN